VYGGTLIGAACWWYLPFGVNQLDVPVHITSGFVSLQITSGSPICGDGIPTALSHSDASHTVTAILETPETLSNHETDYLLYQEAQWKRFSLKFFCAMMGKEPISKTWRFIEHLIMDKNP
jgi:hypothetical protein